MQCSHWFLTEQREEVASMSTLLAVVERGRDNLLAVEQHLALAQAGTSPDASAPPAGWRRAVAPLPVEPA
jgi:bacterioferritin B